MSLRLVAVAAVTLTTLSVPGAALASPGRDRDRDGMPDRYETANGLNPRKNDARADKDKDGLRNLAEFRAGTNPSRADTDGDGLRDGDDKRPKVKDRPRAKFTITSYDSTSGALVVAYGKGSSLTVTVTGETELEWKGGSKACTSPATVANLVAGAGVDKLKLARPTSDDGTKPEDGGHRPEDGGHRPEDGEHRPEDGGHRPEDGEHARPEDSGQHAREATPAGDATPVAEEIGLVCAAGW